MAWKPRASQPPRRAPSFRAGALFCLGLAVFVSPSVLRAHVERMGVGEIAAASPAIVVATVEEIRSRWNDSRSLILTDITLRVEERLRGTTPERITLTEPGGTLGTLSDDTCISAHFQSGARYLLFLDDLRRPTLAPVVGAEQGMFREIPASRDGAGASLAAPGSTSLPMSYKGAPITFRDLVGAVRSLAAHTPLTRGRGIPSAATLGAKTWSPAAPPLSGVRTVPPQLAPETAIPPLPGEGAPGIVESTEAVLFDPRPVAPPSAEKSLFHELAPRPVVVNPLTDSPFAPFDQFQMSSWNRYSNDLFRVLDPPNPTWAYRNDVSDFVGFPEDSVMKRQFGYDWADLGTGVLAVTFARREEGVVVEADVLFNPHKSWSTDTLLATGGPDPVFAFQEVALHELGHVWGLLHPWDDEEWVTWDSVMNYKFRQYYVGELFGDDTAAVRRAFPPGVALRDGLISAYVTVRNDRLVIPDYKTAAPSPATARAGGAFSLSWPIKIENVGTVPLVDPTVEVYLAPTRLSFDGAVLVQRVRVRGKIAAGGTLQVRLKGLKVPRGAAAGIYSLAYLLRDAKDAYQGNNAAWSLDGVTLTVSR